MASGHTDRATINERKALTPGMRVLLDRLKSAPGGRLPHDALTQAEKNQMRGLMDRRLALPNEANDAWLVTPAGVAA